jgi:hypothetical protein
VDAFFEAARDIAAGGGEGFVSLDEGLAIMSKHAQALGYDAIVLFLDELILWLASHAADMALVNREGQKVESYSGAAHERAFGGGSYDPTVQRECWCPGDSFRCVQIEAEEAPATDWLVRLLRSPVYTAQRRMVGRQAPSPQDVEAFLKALVQHRYRMPRRAVAEALGLPEVHFARLLAELQRVLNVDGYQILRVDEGSGIIEIDRQRLDEQFLRE